MRKATHFVLILFVVESFVTINSGQPAGQRSLRLMEEQLRERARIEVLPRYPNGARRKRIQGFVVAEVEFDREGTVKHVEIVESTHPLFVAPTVTALKQWRFNPVVTPKREMLGGKGKLTFYFYYKNSRGWSEYPSIFRRKLNPAKS